MLKYRILLRCGLSGAIENLMTNWIIQVDCCRHFWRTINLQDWVPFLKQGMYHFYFCILHTIVATRGTKLFIHQGATAQYTWCQALRTGFNNRWQVPHRSNLILYTRWRLNVWITLVPTNRRKSFWLHHTYLRKWLQLYTWFSGILLSRNMDYYNRNQQNWWWKWCKTRYISSSHWTTDNLWSMTFKWCPLPSWYLMSCWQYKQKPRHKEEDRAGGQVDKLAIYIITRDG